jgi:BA14K-like protein
MFSPRVLSTVAAIALVVPMAVPTASFAQNQPGKAGAAAGAPRMAAPRMSSGGAPRIMGGGVAPRMGGQPMGGGAPGPRYSGGGGGGGGYRGGYDGGRRRDHDGGGGFIPGAVAGALVGGAIASQGYYGGPGYYAPGYYDDQSYDDSAVAVAPAPGGDDAVAYCMQTYRSYDPQSGTYLGNDGYRHPCP